MKNFYVRPVEIHYDESIAEEVADVFVDSTTNQPYFSGMTLTEETNVIPETGVLLDIILPSTIIGLVALATVVVWKKKEI